jgi:hypothetical protein
MLSHNMSFYHNAADLQICLYNRTAKSVSAHWIGRVLDPTTAIINDTDFSHQSTLSLSLIY